MSSTLRRTRTALIADLQKRIHAYPFLQAVRLLLRSAVFANRKRKAGKHERSPAADNPVGQYTPPNSEFIRFKQNHSLRFPDADIDALHFQEQNNGKRQWVLENHFLSLIGPTGTLPFHYTELISQREKFKDHSLQAFLDMFNHRTTSLFYQASIKYRLPLAYENHALLNTRGDRVDSHSHAILSLIGMGNGAVRGPEGLPLHASIYYSGLLSQQARTSTGLRQMLSDYFQVPIKLEEFVGEWQELIDDVRSRLTSIRMPLGQNVCLGKSALLGKRGWFVQGKLRVIVGPLDSQQYARFAPGTKALTQLHTIVNRFAGAQTDAEYVIRAKREELPARIRLGKQHQTQIGWNTWLAGRYDGQAGSTFDIKLSAARCH